MRDDNGQAQLWTISPTGGPPRQITLAPFGIASACSWHPDGRHVAAIADGSVWVINTTSGETWRLTAAAAEEFWPRGEACVFSPDGRRIAYVQPVHRDGATYNQIFVVETGLA
jgi:Tol biopolymer transport system component